MKVLAFHLPDPIPLEDYEYLLSRLDTAEQGRVRKFRLPQDQARSLVGRLALRYFLLRENLLPRNELPKFGRKGKGKPTLEYPKLDPPLAFNNSHEGRWVMLGVVRGLEADIGVDIMVYPCDPVDLQDAISPQFTQSEKHHLAIPLPLHERAKRLTTLWTIKEGYTKAIGEGVGFGLERIDVEMDSTGQVHAVAVDGRPVGMDGWTAETGKLEFPRGNGIAEEGRELEGLGEGGVVMREEEVGWAVIYKGEEGDWDGRIENVEWEELVAFFEDMKKSGRCK